jgi:hypothetical protein
MNFYEKIHKKFKFFLYIAIDITISNKGDKFTFFIGVNYALICYKLWTIELLDTVELKNVGSNRLH